MTDELAGVYRCRNSGIQDAAFRSFYRNRTVGTFVLWREGIESAFDGIGSIGIGVVHDAIQGSPYLGRTSFKVYLQFIPLDGDPALNDEGFVKPVHLHRLFIDAVWNSQYGLSHNPFSTGLDFSGQNDEVIETRFVEKLHQPIAAHGLSRYLGI